MPAATARTRSRSPRRGEGVLPQALLNPNLASLPEDHFFHVENEELNTKVDLVEKFGDVKIVLLSGPQGRAESIAKQLTSAFGWAAQAFGSTERYSMFKVGPLMAVSHGIGAPSVSCILHELTKLLHYAGCTDVIYLRIGTSGGIGVDPGTLVVSSHAVNTSLESKFETVVLGKRRSFDTTLDPSIAAELDAAAKRAGCPAVVAKTMSTDDYYEEQGRLDGAVEPGYTEVEKMAWLNNVYEGGVRNMEMEGGAFASFCNRTGIRGGLIAAALLNRLKGDLTLGQATPEQIGEYNARTITVVMEWLRGRLAVSRGLQYVSAGEVPIIDMKAWSEGSPEGKQKVVDTMKHACENVGFFFVRGHGVPTMVSNDMFDASRRFFDLPLEEKKKIPLAKDYPYGYENSEVLVQSEQGKHDDARQVKLADLKETFNACLGPETGAHPSTPACRWPENPSDLKEKYTAYYRQCERVVKELLRIGALALDLPEDFFIQRITKHNACLRTLNYPDTRHAPPKPGQLRASPHTDYGLFTVLAASGEGLQLMTENGGWMDVHIPTDCFTVNIGDMLARWTNDKWRSTRHRVVVKEGSTGNRRQSAAFFLNPTPDAQVETISSCITPENPNKYTSLKAVDYLMLKVFSAMSHEWRK